MCLIIFHSLPLPLPVLKVPLENSKEACIICYSLHFLAALKGVDISLVLKLLSDLFVYDICE